MRGALVGYVMRLVEYAGQLNNTSLLGYVCQLNTGGVIRWWDMFLVNLPLVE